MRGPLKAALFMPQRRWEWKMQAKREFWLGFFLNKDYITSQIMVIEQMQIKIISRALIRII